MLSLITGAGYAYARMSAYAHSYENSRPYVFCNFMKGYLLSAVGQAAKLSDKNESVASEFVSDEKAVELIAETALLGPVKGK